MEISRYLKCNINNIVVFFVYVSLSLCCCSFSMESYATVIRKYYVYHFVASLGSDTYTRNFKICVYRGINFLYIYIYIFRQVLLYSLFTETFMLDGKSTQFQLGDGSLFLLYGESLYRPKLILC